MHKLHYILVVIAAGFALAGLFHVVALVMPGIAEPSPPWRHVLFVVLNLGVAAGLTFRPRFFPYLFGVLTAQQLFSHGTYGWTVWREQGRVDWASVVVVVAMPLVLTLLIVASRGAAGRTATASPGLKSR